MKLRVAFFGSPEFAVPSLEVALARCEVALVVSQPDKPAGRGRHLQAPAVKERALAAGVAVAQPPSLRKPPYAPELEPLRLDLAIVVAYGKILPPELLAVPRLGCWNVHGSLLPRWRGAAPIQRALAAGDRETGVTLMQLDAGMDTGPMLLQRQLAVGDDDTSGSLHEKLARLGAELLDEGLGRASRGEAIPAEAQDDRLATAAPMLDKDEGRVDWAQPAQRVRDRIRAVDPWPGAFTLLDGAPLKLWRAHLASGAGAPGEVLGADRDGLIVACGEGALAIAELQLAGRKRMAAQALLAGRPIPPGATLGR